MTRITDERLAELVHDAEHEYWGGGDNVAAALRELQQLRRQHREIICTRCLLREQLAKESPLPEPDPLF